MSYSASLEEVTPQPYKMKVMSELLTQAHIAGIDLEEFVGFFATQIQAMLASPPNYNKFGQKARVWIMRGFYPNTHVFFKIILMENNAQTSSYAAPGGYYAKVSPMRVMYSNRKGYTNEDFVTLDGSKLNEDLTNRMENSIFGAKHDLKPILEKKVRMPSAADAVNMAPSYVVNPYDNNSYISNTKYIGDSQSFTVLDKSSMTNLQQQYNSMNKQYEDKSNYGLLSLADQQNYINSMTSLSQSMVNQIKDYQVQQQKNQAISSAKKDPSYSDLEKAGKYPVMVVGGAYALYRGTTFRLKLTDTTSATAGGSVKDSNASVGLASPVVNTSVGATEQNMTMSISRGIVDHVGITFTNSRPFQSSSGPTSNTVSASYGISL
ncbi:unnamed protein product [Sphagnum balticum]